MKSSLKRVTCDKIRQLARMRAVFDSILFSIVDERIKETIENLARNGGRVAHVLSVYMFAIR